MGINNDNSGFYYFENHKLETRIHLDHGDSYELVASCLDAGFNSVMIDASEKPFDKNIKITRSVVNLAERYGANVETELGYVAKSGQKQIKSVLLNHPKQNFLWKKQA